MSTNRSSPPKVFLGQGVLKIYNKFTRELPCQSVISIKCEITLRHLCSPINLLHNFRTPFPKNALYGCFCTKLTACMSTIDQLCYIWFVYFVSFFMQYCNFGALVNISFSMFWNFLFVICVFKKLWELSDVFHIFFKRYFFINKIQNFYEAKDWTIQAFALFTFC